LVQRRCPQLKKMSEWERGWEVPGSWASLWVSYGGVRWEREWSYFENSGWYWLRHWLMGLFFYLLSYCDINILMLIQSLTFLGLNLH
jgi:hypothetical protein